MLRGVGLGVSLTVCWRACGTVSITVSVSIGIYNHPAHWQRHPRAWLRLRRNAPGLDCLGPTTLIRDGISVCTELPLAILAHIFAAEWLSRNGRDA